jgi:hypothetical protein
MSELEDLYGGRKPGAFRNRWQVAAFFVGTAAAYSAVGALIWWLL